jgi:tellurite methyltransferase
VLDLGCGEGRDSVFFANRGCDVTAVDLSRAGLRKGERLARQNRVTVGWIQGDMSRVSVDGPFDLIYSCGSIHYVPRVERAELFRKLKTLTRPGGHHAHIVFTNKHVYVEKGEVVEHFTPGELAAAYADWTMVRRVDRLISCAQDGTAHRHSVEELIAKAAH